MSFQIAAGEGMRVALSASVLPISTFSSGLFLGFYLRSASGYIRGLILDGISDGARPSARLGAYPATRSPWMWMSRAGGAQYNAYYFTDYPDNTGWALVWGKWNPAANGGSGNIRTGHGDVAGSLSGDGDLTDWVSAESSADIRAISVGTQKNYLDNSTEEGSTVDCLIALPFIAKREPTGSELTALVSGGSGGGGAHPLAVFGSDLVDYWPPDSKTSGINGWVLVDTAAGTVDIITGGTNNPTVDGPPAAGPDINAVNGLAMSSISAFSGIAKSGIVDINGQAI